MSDDNTSGKGKAKARDDGSTEQQSQDQNLGNRIAASATGLLRDAVAPRHDAAATLSSSAALGNKATYSSFQPLPPEVLDRRTQQQADRGWPQGINSNTSRELGESFRSSTTTGVETFANFEDFANSSQLRFGDTHAPPDPLHTNLEERWQATASPVHSSGVSTPKDHPHQSVYGDGADVRALLADPSFNAGLDGPSMANEGVEEQSVDDLFPQNFSENEKVAIEQVKKDLPPPPEHKTMPRDHPLALRPRTDEENEKISNHIRDILAEASGTGAFDTDEHCSVQAVRVLDSYADDVWGDALPDVQKMREDLVDVQLRDGVLDSKAVARLKMIMKHLNPNLNWSREG